MTIEGNFSPSDPGTPEEKAIRSILKGYHEVQAKLDEIISHLRVATDPSLHPGNATEEDTAQPIKK